MNYKAIKILKCSDPHMWYSRFIGCYVPYVNQYEKEYLSREPAGFTNIVLKDDGTLLEFTDSDWYEQKIVYYGN